MPPTSAPAPAPAAKLTHRHHADRRHLVGGEGAGLVRADDGGAAEGLDRGQLSDDHVPLRHSPGAQAEARVRVCVPPPPQDAKKNNNNKGERRERPTARETAREKEIERKRERGGGGGRGRRDREGEDKRAIVITQRKRDVE